MKMKEYMLTFFGIVWIFCGSLWGQTLSKEEIVGFTSEWTGERDNYGRPLVPDDILQRMKNVSIEEAWSVLRGEGYNNQFEGGWLTIHSDKVIVGRVLTAQYMPLRPDISNRILEKGKQQGRIGNSNSWPIDMLQKGDVYVADAFNKGMDGTLIGDNLGNSIYAKSGNGVIFNGSLRDLEGLEQIEGFNAYVRSWNPTYLKEVMLTGINVPINIGQVTVFPGDVVLAKREGIIFIPAHLAERVVITAEIVMLRDRFSVERLKAGKYTPGQIDSKWTDAIEKDFGKWLDDHKSELPVSKEKIQEFLKTRTW
ncbi:MAG: RraA family protein [Cyclobacteriaceae bacterium]|nr:RraA family protein [Cyclobacteriaceae bacterium]